MKEGMPTIAGAVLGLIAMFSWYLYDTRDKSWVNQKRKCPVCKKRMIPTISKSENKKIWCCSNWKQCKTYIEHHTGERLSAAEVERTDGKAAL